MAHPPQLAFLPHPPKTPPVGRLFAIIGMISLGALLLVIAAVSFAFYEGNKLDRAATEYSVDAVTAITSTWDAEALRQRAAPELARSLSGEQARRVMNWVATLGPLENRPVCQGNAIVSTGTGGSRTTANITCTAQYRAGEATIQLSLIRKEGAWSILGFHVGSPMLVPQPARKA